MNSKHTALQLERYIQRRDVVICDMLNHMLNLLFSRRGIIFFLIKLSSINGKILVGVILQGNKSAPPPPRVSVNLHHHGAPPRVSLYFVLCNWYNIHYCLKEMSLLSHVNRSDHSVCLKMTLKGLQY